MQTGTDVGEQHCWRWLSPLCCVQCWPRSCISVKNEVNLFALTLSEYWHVATVKLFLLPTLIACPLNFSSLTWDTHSAPPTAWAAVLPPLQLPAAAYPGQLKCLGPCHPHGQPGEEFLAPHCSLAKPQLSWAFGE